MNKAILIGRATKEPELKFTKDGKAVATFTLAVNRGFSKEADFLKIVVWDKQAENVAQYVKKGSQVAVEGSIKTGSYDKDGQKVFTTDIQASRVEFLSKVEVNDDVEDVFFPKMEDDDVPF